MVIVGSAQLEQKNETIEIIKQKFTENKLWNDNDIKELLPYREFVVLKYKKESLLSTLGKFIFVIR